MVLGECNSRPTILPSPTRLSHTVDSTGLTLRLKPTQSPPDTPSAVMGVLQFTLAGGSKRTTICTTLSRLFSTLPQGIACLSLSKRIARRLLRTYGGLCKLQANFLRFVSTVISVTTTAALSSSMAIGPRSLTSWSRSSRELLHAWPHRQSWVHSGIH